MHTSATLDSVCILVYTEHVTSEIPLTARQNQALRCIEESIANLGYPPTLAELAAALGVTSTFGVTNILGALEKKGYIERRTERVARGIRVLKPAA